MLETEKRWDANHSAAPELETARRIHGDVLRAIGETLGPGRGSGSTANALREFTLWVVRQAEEDGVVLSEDDYAELLDAITRVDVAYRVGALVSELLHVPPEGHQWSGGLAAFRHYSSMEQR